MHLGTWFRGGLDSALLTTALSDLKGLFQSEQFYEKAEESGNKSPLNHSFFL